MSEMRFRDAAGSRLYTNAKERTAFLATVWRQLARDRTVWETLRFTGCRPSELSNSANISGLISHTTKSQGNLTSGLTAF